MKKLIAIIIIVVLSPRLVAQDNPFTPPTYSTPEAASLAKSINHPVNMNTGVPGISVPLHTIDIGGFTIPITLNYHAGGFKINELAGRYGLGWSLSCELQITRTINGTDDLLMSGYLNTDALYNSSENSRNHQLATGQTDGLPDRFYYSLLTKSGSFFFQRSSAGSYYTIIPEPYEDIKIEYDKTEGVFKIIDIDGTVYTYGGATHNDTPKKRGLEFSDDNIITWKCTKITNIDKGIDIEFNYLAKPKELRISSEDYIEYWKKSSTKMTDANNKGETFPPVVVFDYQKASSYAHKLIGEYYKIHIAGKATELHFVYKNKYSNILEERIFYDPNSAPLGNGNYVKGISLSSIKYRGGIIKFKGSECLSSIEVMDSKSNLIKKIDLFQKYEIDKQGVGANYHGLYYMDLDAEDNKEIDINNKTYKGTNYLDSIQIKGKDNRIYDKFAFEYYSKECFGNHLRNRDIWGGFNEWTTPILSWDKNIAIPNIKQNFPYSMYNYSSNGKWQYTLGDSLNYQPETPNEYKMQTGILKRIHYATGGYVHFDYEANRYQESIRGDYSTYKTVKLAGGLRIKTISYFDGTAKFPIKQKFYRYGEYEEGVGEISRGATHIDYQNKQSFTYGSFSPFIYTQTIRYAVPNTADEPCTETKYTYKPSSSKDLTYESGSPVYYTKVTEYNSDMGKETGKTVHRYYPSYEFNSDVTNRQGFMTVGNIPHIKPKWNTGMLKSVTEYRYEKQKYYLQHHKEYFYKKHNKGVIKAQCAYLSTYYQAVNSSTYLKAADPHDIIQLHSYSYSSYDIPMGKMLIDREVEKWAYKDTVAIIQETTYEYEKDYVQPSSIKTKNSNGNTIVTTLRYPYHFNNIFPYNIMLANNNISPVIEKKTLIGNKEKKELTDYKSITANSKNLIVPSSIRYSYNGENPQTEFTFDQYDEYGNLLQMKGRDNIPKSFLWGYNSRLLLAEISGADYNTVKNTVNIATIQNPGSESVLKDELSKLQLSNNIPFATTLTYDNSLPVIKSITTANIVNAYYSYDSFGRLTSQSDDDLSLVSDINYNQAGFKEKVVDKQKAYVKSPSMESFSFHKDNELIMLFNYVDRGGFHFPNRNVSIWSYYNNEVPNPDHYDDYTVGSEGGDQDAEFYKKEDLVELQISAPYHTYGKSLVYDYENNLDLKVAIQIDFIQNEHIVATKIFRVKDYVEGKILKHYMLPGKYKIAFRFQPYDGAVFAPYMTNHSINNSHLLSGNNISLSKGTVYELKFIRF